ncbi:hypothetical protein [Polynucleobacter campilacus]|uniref:O-antigen polymerase n=1 Tax=Polynucleobacter campilacus TaxID=1743163 RepID=A0A254Q701_9BURK|nr:hypothetical protein [Polynucleobacter campilacus]OWS70677.1 hypothetical protein CBI31_00020 [Polynucleobacter campilacus]
MQAISNTTLPNLNTRWISCLGLVLILISSVLLGIWAVKDTIALRNILLVLGTLISLVFLYQYFQINSIRAIGLTGLPFVCIVIALIWVLFHYYFFSLNPEVQLRELKSIWLRSALASILGLATGIALMKQPRAITLFWLAILLGFFVLFAQYLPLALQSGKLIVPLDHTDFRRYLFIGKINPMYLGVLLIAGSTGLLLDAVNAGQKSWLRIACIFWLICLLTAMYAFAFIVNTRSGILLGSLPVIAWSLYGLVYLFIHRQGLSILRSAAARRYIYMLALALVLTGIFAYQQIQRDSGWLQIIEDVKIGYQVEKYPNWQNVDLYGFPKNESGNVVAYNTYERVAWATAGIKSIPNHPYGVGILILPLGLAAKELFPGVTPISTHSGWVDLTLAFGIPFICLMWLANASIAYRAIRQQSPFKYTLITLSIILFGLFLVGELSNGHNLEMLFYFFALMAGMQVAQKITSFTHSELSAK